MDGDAGVRVEGRFRGKKCFAFVTRFGSSFTVLVYSAEGEGARRKPGVKLASREFTNPVEALDFLKPIAVPRVRAYAY